MGLFKRKDSRFWWMGYTLNGEHHYESTKTTSKDLAIKIWKHRESEITLKLFALPLLARFGAAHDAAASMRRAKECF